MTSKRFCRKVDEEMQNFWSLPLMFWAQLVNVHITNWKDCTCDKQNTNGWTTTTFYFRIIYQDGTVFSKGLNLRILKGRGLLNWFGFMWKRLFLKLVLEVSLFTWHYLSKLVYGYSQLLNETVISVRDTLDSQSKELGLGLDFSLNSLFRSNHGTILLNSHANSSSTVNSMEFMYFFLKINLSSVNGNWVVTL